MKLDKRNFEFYEKFLPIEKTININTYPDYKNRIPEPPPIKFEHQPIGMGLTTATTYTDENDVEYLERETNAIIEQLYCYETIADSDKIHLSFRLNKISPNENIFFSAYIFVSDGLTEIDYIIKSKYSFENEKGQLRIKN